jgi:hypothetical protein
MQHILRLDSTRAHFEPARCSSSWFGTVSWFGTLFGFEEEGSYAEIKSKFELDSERRILLSKENGKRYTVGDFSTPSLKELRETGQRFLRPGALTVKHVISGDILPHHASSSNNGATFQAASQFNCLEFASPDALPEMGVAIYAHDHTQGPACSIAAGPATVYRNYFADVGGQEGQTRDKQLNNLDNLSTLLSSQMPKLSHTSFFDVRNGYTFSTAAKLEELNTHLISLSEEELDKLRASIKVGKHSGVEVPFKDRSWTLREGEGARQLVSQVFCSAISCAYGNVPNNHWQPLATLVLEANYEATLWAAMIDASLPGGTNKVYLTLLGGGVFGNEPEWICRAIQRALDRFREADLHVVIAHYSGSTGHRFRHII